jgi:hypothetical protein
LNYLVACPTAFAVAVLPFTNRVAGIILGVLAAALIAVKTIAYLAAVKACATK